MSPVSGSRLIALVAGLAVWPAAARAEAAPPDPTRDQAAPVIAAERAFAADAAEIGITASFNKWAAPDAILIGPAGVLRVPEAYPPEAPRSVDESSLVWWPNFAGVSRSGDLGFTTGGVEVDHERTGHYFTIWVRQADGSWRWTYDGGSGASAAGVPDADSAPLVLATAPRGSDSADAAMAEVRAMEQQLAERARVDQVAAHLEALLPAGRIYVAPLPPATGEAAMAEALRHWPATFDFGPTISGGASDAGDLVWTYGAAAWTRDGHPRRGFYVRLWQRQADRWALVFAQLLPAAPARP